MKRRLIIGSVILLLLLIGGIAWFSREAPVHYLAEASIPKSPYKLRLLKVSDEPFEYVWKAPPMEKVLWYFRSPQKKNRLQDIDLHFRGVTFYDRHPAKGFLFRYVDSDGDWVNPNQGSGQFRFAESTGGIYRDLHRAPEFGSGASIESISQLPRRDRTLHIEWKITSSKADPGQMHLPNPFYREDFPEWKPLPLPQTQTRGEITVELKTMRPWALGSNLEFKVSSLSGDWHSGGGHDSKYVFMQDATGNTVQVLSPFEPAWKIVIRTFRNRLAKHPPERIHLLGTFKLPVPGTVIPIDREVKVGESKVRLLYVAGAGTVTNTKGQYAGSKDLTTPAEGHKKYSSKRIGWASQTQPFLYVSFGEIPADREVYVRCQTADEWHSDTELENRLWFEQSKIIPLPIPTSPAKPEVDLSIIENICEQFEFIVEPPEEMREKVRRGEYDQYWKWLE